MTGTLIERLGHFAAESRYDSLPAPVTTECKLIFLDAIGCALAAADTLNGRIGIQYGAWLGGAGGTSTVIGRARQASIPGAAFANGELINALDFDGVLPPGHVTPYVLPGALAIGEDVHCTGKAFITVMAVAHEMSHRFGRAMDYLRDIVDGQVHPPAVYGYSSAIFGATAAIARLRELTPGVTANALGIAGSISPVNSQAAWFECAPCATTKYTLAGTLVQSALTAACMAEFGHSGNTRILDDRSSGYARYIGTSRWEPSAITEGLGDTWLFPAAQTYKPYPHCRIFHGLIDALTEIIDAHDIQPEEIDAIEAWVEGFVTRPVWLNQQIETAVDAQFSLAHGLAVAAHRIPIGKRWQDPDVLSDPSILALMRKVTHRPHPDYVALLTQHPSSRPARIKVRARGQEFISERLFPRGSKSADPANNATPVDLEDKFRRNAAGVLTEAATERAIATVLHLERVADINDLTEVLRPAP